MRNPIWVLYGLLHSVSPELGSLSFFRLKVGYPFNLEHPRTYSEKIKPAQPHDCDSLVVHRRSYKLICFKEYVRYACMDIDYSKLRCLVVPISAAERLDREFYRVRVSFGSMGGHPVPCYISFASGTRCEGLRFDGLGYDASGWLQLPYNEVA